MSLPSPGLAAPRQRRAASVATSRPAPYQHAESSLSNQHDDSLSSQDLAGANSIFATNPNSLSQREPTRSFFHSSFRGQLAPIDSLQNARHVREDTAELASYALSDNASIRSVSPSGRSSSITQAHLDSYFPQLDDDQQNPIPAIDLRKHIIYEVSEPVSPDNVPHQPKSQGKSALANLLRNSPPHTSPPNEEANTEDDDTDTDDEEDEDPGHHGFGTESTERTSLLPKDSNEQRHPDYLSGEHDLENQSVPRRATWPKLSSVALQQRENAHRVIQVLSNPKGWDRKAIWEVGVAKPIGYLPAVLLGSLLNVLDALSYGMILFPLGQPLFESLGSAGISMFYVSCIISQLVYSCGGSAFKGGVGSEMIEVVPFFHKMAFTIMERVGEDKPEAVIATTIMAYASSAVFTGLVFFLMGYFKAGYIVGFIPRHILVGCIGGVGWFLVATGFEVTARLDSNLNYNLETLRKMFQTDTIALWLIPLALAIIYSITTRVVKSKYYLAAFILVIPAVFYFFELAIEEVSMPQLKEKGWVFDGPDADEPWWYFWTLYKFDVIDWEALVETIPAMCALTFFGVLHVPINVPALGFTVGEDDVDLNRELMAHGVSNALSGFAGSIQNYLVYTNSVQFIKSGGDHRMAGVMLAAATMAIMFIGPIIIGYIPVMMVGCLIFILGFELLEEAIHAARHKLMLWESLTVFIIVVVMGAYDFVVGIGIGIALAFASLVFQTAGISAIRGSYSGEVVGSTVRRNATQQKFLREVGNQVHVTKLAGYLFFGTIVSVEARIKSLIDDEAFHHRPIRYLIFDLFHVTGIDYSAAEAFTRINRAFSKKGVAMVISGIAAEHPMAMALRNVSLGELGKDGGNEVKMLPDLNSALESCENELLKTFYANRDARAARNAPSMSLEVPQSSPRASNTTYSIDAQFSSPRRNHLHRVATSTLNETESSNQPKWQNFKEPLRLMLQTFQGLTNKNEDFWFRAVPFFTKNEYPAGTTLYHRGQEANGFYLLEEGIFRAEYQLPQGHYFESIVAGTSCGELPFFSETDRTATVQAERDCVAWLMDRQQWQELQVKDAEVAQELLRISLKMTTERMSAITSYVLTTAG